MMSARTMFWFAVVTLTAVWSAKALPMVADEDSRPPIFVVENLDTPAPLVEVPKKEVEQRMDGMIASPVLKTEDKTAPKVNSENDDAEDSIIRTNPNDDSVEIIKKPSSGPIAPIVPDVPNIEQMESATGTNSPSSDAKPNPSFVPVQTESTIKPNPNKDVEQTVRPGSNIPFFLEFFQPFQSFQPFQPYQPLQPSQPFGFNHEKQPSRHQPMIPFGAPIDPFSMHAQPFDQMVDAYTNEFRTPKVIILKPKRNVRLNTTGMPPIPLLMNIMLNAFRHGPSDMLTSFNKMSMSQMDNFGDAQGESDQPLKKTTSKTEIIDGHRVQINETTVTNGNGNHKSFYHYKEIQVLPEETNKKISNEQLTSMAVVNSDTQNVELGGLKDETMDNAPGSVPLNDHFQAASTNDYAPRYGFHPHISGIVWMNYDPIYPTPNKGSKPETDNSISMLHDTDINDKVNSSRPSGGSGKIQLLAPTPNPSSKPETENSISMIHETDINDKKLKSKDSMILLEDFISLINDTRVNDGIQLPGGKIPADVEMVYLDGNGQLGTEYKYETIDNIH